MAQAKITWILISIALISMFTGVMAIWWGALGEHYGYPADSQNLSGYNKLSELNADVQGIKEKSTTIEEEQGAADRLGNFFGNAYSILATIPKSFDIIFDFLNIAILEIPMGDSGDIISITLQTILLILIFIGIILAILLKVTT